MNFSNLFKPMLILFLMMLTITPMSTTAAEVEIKPAPLTNSEMKALFTDATHYFHEATVLMATDNDSAKKLYKKSLIRFEKLVENGVVNGKIYYNIANAYFRLDDIGNAILNYRRAEKLTPFDPNLTQNLNYALSKRLDKIEVQEEEKIMKTLFFWHYDLSQKAKIIIFASFYILFWVMASLRFTRLRLPRWPLATALIVSILFGSSLAAESFHVDNRGVLIATEVIARKGDGITYQPRFTDPLHAGTDFTLLETRPNWFYIQLADGRKCWIPSESASLL